MESGFEKRKRSKLAMSSLSHASAHDVLPTDSSRSRRRLHLSSNQSHESSRLPIVPVRKTSSLLRDDDGIVVTNVASHLPSFRPGNLVRVEMKNFLTFTHTVFKPGPRMNLVIGPNGTGKSTIVSAVCIVFGGKPTILGRNPDLGAFVKYGTSKASVEAWLHEPSHSRGYISVKRDFDSEGKGNFYMDGERVRQKDIITLVEKYDIQLDNMSQFMPQEKIAEFTNHKPEELLKLAIRSLGGVAREEEYFSLMEEDSKLANHTATLEKNQEAITKLKEEQDNDREEVAAYRQQQTLRENVDLLRRFRPTVDEIETRLGYSNLRKEMRDLEAALGSLENELKQRMTGPVNACKQAVDAAKNTYSASKASVQARQASNEEYAHKVESISMKLVEKSKQLKDVGVAAERARRSVDLAKSKLAQAEEAYSRDVNTSDSQIENHFEELSQKRSKLRDSCRELTTRTRPLEEDLQNAIRKVKHFGQRLEGLEDVRQQRMERLQRRGGERILRVEQIVRRMTAGNAFHRRVYGPVVAEIEVEDAYHARIMEHAVSGWLVTAFVTESARDSRILLEECARHFNGWKPDIITTPTTRNDEIDYETIRKQCPSRPIDTTLEELGIINTVSNIYRAPDAVKAALNAQAGLFNVYVGDDRALGNQELLRQTDGIPAWYTPESRCMVSGSRFDSNARNMRVDTSFINIKGDLYRGSMMDAKRKRDEYSAHIRQGEDSMAIAKRGMVEIEQQHGQLQAKIHEIEIEIRALTEQRAERRRRLQHVEHCKSHLQEMIDRAARRDECKIRDELRTAIDELEEQALERLRNLADGARQLAKGLSKMDEALIECLCAEREMSVEESKHADLKKEIEEKRRQCGELRQERDRLKSEWREKKDVASRSISEEEIQQHHEFLVPYHQQSLQELDAAIQNLDDQILGMASSGRSIIDAFELRENKIKHLEREIKKQEQWFNERHGDLVNRKQVFLSWLSAGINRMREKFSSLYGRLGCSGDIRLMNMEGHNLKDLTLQVLVSYRHDVDLRPVSAMANSGGEKMCCTMIFCFSLQLEEERIPPFVMVDELNQGLDPTNEMKIMTMMMEDAAKETGPQSFVVTPKLLSNLPLSSCTKTHIVFNGPVKGKDDLFSS